jgi:hypothetical protein
MKDYCEAVAKATGVPIPKNYPVVGEDAFRTGTGVHAAAVIKAYRKNDVLLANSIYSGVPAHHFGMEQIIEVGPMSGKSNVMSWLSVTVSLLPMNWWTVSIGGQEFGQNADRSRDHAVRPGGAGRAVEPCVVNQVSEQFAV